MLNFLNKMLLISIFTCTLNISLQASTHPNFEDEATIDSPAKTQTNFSTHTPQEENSTSIYDLPKVILSHIFKHYLDGKQRKEIALTCKRFWLEVRKIGYVTLNPHKSITKEGISALLNSHVVYEVKTPEALRLKETNPPFSKFIQEFVKKADSYCNNFDPKELTIFLSADLPNIRKIDVFAHLSASPKNNNIFNLIFDPTYYSFKTNWQNLTHLCIHGANTSDNVFDNISNAPFVKNLIHLSIEWNELLTSTGIEKIVMADWQSLRVLNLGGCENIRDEGSKLLAQKGKWPKLECLYLHCTNQTVEGAKMFFSGKYVFNYLLIENNFAYSDDLTPKFQTRRGWNVSPVRKLFLGGGACNKLRNNEIPSLFNNNLIGFQLEMWCPNLFQGLKKLQCNLVELILDNRVLNNADIINLCEISLCKQLKLLSLSNNRIGDEGAIALSTTPFDSLQVLLLDGNKIKEGGATALYKTNCMPNIIELDLTRNKVRDNGASFYLNRPERRNFKKALELCPEAKELIDIKAVEATLTESDNIQAIEVITQYFSNDDPFLTDKLISDFVFKRPAENTNDSTPQKKRKK